MSAWRQYSLNRSLGEHSVSWEALRIHLGYANPMLSSNFIDRLLAYFGDGSEVLWLLGDATNAKAMAILKPGRFGVWRTFLPGQAQIAPVLGKDVSVFRSMFASLPRTVMQIDLLSLDPMFGGNNVTDHGLQSVVDHDLTMSISLNGNFDEYCQGRSKKLINNIRRYQGRVATQGLHSRFSLHDEPSAISEALVRYCILESAGWKGKQGTALSVGGEQHRFYEEVLTRFASTGNAFIYELWFDDELVASRLCIAEDSTVVTLKTAYLESFSSLSPGRQLLMGLIRLQFSANPEGKIEFYTNATPDQLTWATEKRWISHYTLFRNEPCRVLLEGMKSLLWCIGPSRASESKSWKEMRIADFSNLTELPDAVKEVMFVAERRNPEQGVDWYANFVVTAVPEDVVAKIYALYDGDSVVAALPVKIFSDKGGVRLESLGNFYTSLYQPYISEHLSVGALAHLLRRMISDNGPVSSIRLTPMDVDSHTYRHLRLAMSRAGLASFSYFCFGNWYFPVSGLWSDYIASRGEQLKNTLKRRSKELRKAGGTMEVITSEDRVEYGISAYESVYAASWKTPEPYPKFVPGLIRMLARKGWLRLAVASLEGQPIAAQVWIVAHGRASIFKLAYDDGFKKYSPGSLLTELLMQYVFEVDRVYEIDYLIGDDPYKADWMSHRRERWGIAAYNLTTTRGAFGCTKEVIGRLLKPLLIRKKMD